MSNAQSKLALMVLQWVFGIVILAESVQFVLPGAAHGFAQTHLPAFIRLVLGWGEIIGGVLLLIPPTTVRGAWLLMGIFTAGIVIHLMHGMHNVGNLVIYLAVAFAIASAKES